MNFRLTGILVIIAIAVVAGVYFFEGRRDTSQDAAKTAGGQPIAVLDWKAADVTRIKVSSPIGQIVEVVRDGGTWKLTAPVQAPADNARLDTVARQIAEARATRKLEAKDVNLAELGLDNPAFTINIATASQERTLKVGGETPDGTSYYTQRDGDAAVYTISSLNISGATSMLNTPSLMPTPPPVMTVLPPEPTAAPTGLPSGTGTPRP